MILQPVTSGWCLKELSWKGGCVRKSSMQLLTPCTQFFPICTQACLILRDLGGRAKQDARAKQFSVQNGLIFGKPQAAQLRSCICLLRICLAWKIFGTSFFQRGNAMEIARPSKSARMPSQIAIETQKSAWPRTSTE